MDTVESFLLFGGGGGSFVGSQNLPGSWGHNFVAGSILLINIKQMLVNVYILVGMQVCAQGLPTKAINIVPQKQWWFHNKYSI